MQIPGRCWASAVAVAAVATTLSGCGGESSVTTAAPSPSGPGPSPTPNQDTTTANPAPDPEPSPAPSPVNPATTTAAPVTTTTTPGCVKTVFPHTGTLSEEARIVDELNDLYLAFDEEDPTSGNGVTIRMTDDFTMWCGTGCNNGMADCRVSASVYNHKVMLNHETNHIAVTMSRDAGIIFNQTAVETIFGKCSFMYDAATFSRVNRGCGCSSTTPYCGNHGSPYDSEDCDWNGTPREWNQPIPGSCKPNQATSPDVAECRCDAPNPRYPFPSKTTDLQCFWPGVALNGTEGQVPDQLRDMIMRRIQDQPGTEDLGDAGVRYKIEYWNEIVLDAEVLINALHENPRAAVAAFMYVRGHGAGRDKANRMSQKALQDYGGSLIPVIEMDPNVDGTCNGPFRVPGEGEDATSIVV